MQSETKRQGRYFALHFSGWVFVMLLQGILVGCAAHATSSFSDREAQLQVETPKSNRIHTAKPVPSAHIAQNIKAPADRAVGDSPAAEAESTLPTEAFSQPQNPEKKSLKAALTCGRMVLKKGGRALCYAPVRMWREDVEITCESAQAIFGDNGALQQLVCQGQVRIVTSDHLGFAKKAVYDEETQKITLEDEAKLKQKGMQLKGKKVVMDLVSEEVSVEGGVQGLYTPAQKEGSK